MRKLDEMRRFRSHNYSIRIRTGTHKDLPFLEEMLFEAFFWDPHQPRLAIREFLQQPEFQRLLSGWGRNGDRAVIGEDDNSFLSVGAAWYRFWTEEDHTYGFVNSETPELGMGVQMDYRSKGVGRALLRALINVAQDNGIHTLSLSVAPQNFALQLYESEGFTKVGESGTSWTMILRV